MILYLIDYMDWQKQPELFYSSLQFHATTLILDLRIHRASMDEHLIYESLQLPNQNLLRYQ